MEGGMGGGMGDEMLRGHIIDPNSILSPAAQGDLISALGMDDLW